MSRIDASYSTSLGHFSRPESPSPLQRALLLMSPPCVGILSLHGSCPASRPAIITDIKLRIFGERILLARKGLVGVIHWVSCLTEFSIDYQLAVWAWLCQQRHSSIHSETIMPRHRWAFTTKAKGSAVVILLFRKGLHLPAPMPVGDRLGSFSQCGRALKRPSSVW